MPRLILACLMCLAALGCSRLPSLPGRAALFEARPDTRLPYAARLVTGRGSDRFRVAVASNGAGLEATRESVRFPGTRYCLRQFGTTDIVWTAPPGRPDAWTGTVMSDGRVLYEGRCAGR